MIPLRELWFETVGKAHLELLSVIADLKTHPLASDADMQTLKTLDNERCARSPHWMTRAIEMCPYCRQLVMDVWSRPLLAPECPCRSLNKSGGWIKLAGFPAHVSNGNDWDLHFMRCLDIVPAQDVDSPVYTPPGDTHIQAKARKAMLGGPTAFMQTRVEARRAQGLSEEDYIDNLRQRVKSGQSIAAEIAPVGIDIETIAKARLIPLHDPTTNQSPRYTFTFANMESYDFTLPRDVFFFAPNHGPIQLPDGPRDSIRIRGVRSAMDAAYLLTALRYALKTRLSADFSTLNYGTRDTQLEQVAEYFLRADRLSHGSRIR